MDNDKKYNQCFLCHEKGHFARDCPKKNKSKSGNQIHNVNVSDDEFFFPVNMISLGKNLKVDIDQDNSRLIHYSNLVISVQDDGTRKVNFCSVNDRNLTESKSVRSIRSVQIIPNSLRICVPLPVEKEVIDSVSNQVIDLVSNQVIDSVNDQVMESASSLVCDSVLVPPLDKFCGMVLSSHNSLIIKNGFVNGKDVRILIDSGAVLNLVSEQAVIDKWNMVQMHTPLEFVDGGKYVSPGVIPSAIVSFDQWYGIVDLTVCKIANYDLILGLPWLKQFNPVINWNSHEFSFPQINQPIFINNVEFAKELEDNQSEVVLICHVQLVDRNDSTLSINTISANKQKNCTEIANDMQKLVSEFQDIFPKEIPNQLPPLREINHSIPLVDGCTPPRRQPYRVSSSELEEIKRQLKDLIDKGFIRPSKSPFGAPVLLVKKKDGSSRMCIDYRSLNKISIKDSYPLPRIDDLLDKLSTAKVFTKLDLKSGYNQIRITPGDEEKTAFTTRYGLFEFTVMSFGLTNAPATFQRTMNNIFVQYLDEFILVYLDDILIFSVKVKDHPNQCRIAFETLRKNNFLCNNDKCTFAVTEVGFAGHIIEDGTVKMDPSKISAISKWKSPTNITEVRSFHGFCNYYRRFIKDFGIIMAPITKLLQKDCEWYWGSEQQEAFNLLKKLITSEPILRLPNNLFPFIIHVDASLNGIGVVLSQIFEDGNEHPIAFDSRKLALSEQNFAVREMEMLALIHALKIWRIYLYGKKFTAYTDHESLKYLHSQKELNRRDARWLNIIQEFDFEIKYKPGPKNIVADSLSRLPITNVNVISNEVFTILKQDLDNMLLPANLQKEYNKDPFLKSIWKAYQEGNGNQYPKFQLENNLLYVNDMEHKRLVIPSTNRFLITAVLKDFHDSPVGGHLGFEKTLEKVKRQFFWKNMYNDIKEYVSTCSTCQQSKPSNRSSYGQHHPLQIPNNRWSDISIDFIGPLPITPDGYDAIFSITCRLTKRVHCFPCKTTDTAKDVAKNFLKYFFRLHGIPLSIVSDRDVRFTSSWWKELQEILGVKLLMSTAFHPQTDGATERFNRTAIEILRSFCNYKQDNWDILLPLVEFAINDSVNVTTGFTPFMLDLGYNPRAIDVHSNIPATITNQDVIEFITAIKRNLSIAYDRIIEKQQVQIDNANKHLTKPDFQVGDFCWVSTAHFMLDAHRERSSHKLLPKWEGPFEILELIGTNACKLKLPEGHRAHPVVNFDKLSKFKTDNRNLFPGRNPTPPPPEIIEQHLEHEVESILDRRKRGKQVQYLVQYKNESVSQALWIPLKELTNCSRLINEYDVSHPFPESLKSKIANSNDQPSSHSHNTRQKK